MGMKGNPKGRMMITRGELATRWGLSESSLKRMEQRGLITPVKLGERILRYDLREIEAREQSSKLDRKA